MRLRTYNLPAISLSRALSSASSIRLRFLSSSCFDLYTGIGFVCSILISLSLSCPLFGGLQNKKISIQFNVYSIQIIWSGCLQVRWDKSISQFLEKYIDWYFAGQYAFMLSGTGLLVIVELRLDCPIDLFLEDDLNWPWACTVCIYVSRNNLVV